MADTITYPTPAASLPNASFRWLDSAGNPIDFTTGWTFQMKIGRPPSSAQIIKTSGITGLSGASNTANLVVAWADNELVTLTPGRWYFQITATAVASGAQRILTGTIKFDYNPL